MPLYRVLVSIEKKSDGEIVHVGNITQANNPIEATGNAWKDILARHLRDDVNLATDVIYHCSAELVGWREDRTDRVFNELGTTDGDGKTQS